MPFLIQYILKLSISLGVVWIFYQLVLRRVTFYHWNRFFLLGYSSIAFIIPFIDISAALHGAQLSDHSVVQLIPNVETMTNAVTATDFSVWDGVIGLITTGCFILVSRLVIQHISFIRLQRSAILIAETPVKLFQVNDNIIPFSFGNAIYINQSQHSENDLREIVRHEFIHVKENHSIDIVFAEWLCILNWFNPFAWMIRHAIRQNLEFIADSKVIETGINKKEYQYLLLKVLGVSQYSLASNFNFNSLKKRVAMMNKMRTAKVHLMRFVFILPLVAIMLVAFRNKKSEQAGRSFIPTSTDTIPKEVKPIKPVFPGNVTSIVTVNNVVTVKMKDGTTETFDLNKPDKKAAFEKKYGGMPEPPTPPEPPVRPVAPAAMTMPPNISSIEINNNYKATVKLKNGKVEKYDLNNPDEKKVFDRKYGDLTPSPPTPPTPPTAPVVPKHSLEPVVASTVTVTGLEAVISSDALAPVVAVSGVISGDIIELQPSTPDLSPVEKEEVITEISKYTTKEDLVQLKRDLSAKGYTLSISITNYNDGELQFVEGTIADKYNTSRFLGEDFKKIVVSRVTYKNGKTGFHIRIIEGVIKI